MGKTQSWKWLPKEVRAVLCQILDDGYYNDEGDFVLPHPPPITKEEDYLEPESIVKARALLKRLQGANHG